MQRSIPLLACAAFCIAASGCAVGRQKTPVMPPTGIIVTAYNAPLTVDFDEVPTRNRKGSVSSWYLREPFLTNLDFAFGDVSLDAAARNGKLSKVSYADYHTLQILGIFGRFTITAYGE